ncbi:MAG: riboflavin biosynthesis protein RibF [Trueperaceae bacterium]|nr:MAG: riboflavin biosynthesis protein RibF [Trueperaceae bacterium]
MRIVDSPDELLLKGAILSIGNFDGVHLGHDMLLTSMQQLAAETDRPSIVLTFFPPSKVLFGEATFLTDTDEKLALLESYAPSAVVVIPFDHDYAKTSKTTFLNQLRRLAPHTIIVGEDFRFGHNRLGTLNDLSRLPKKLEVFGLKTIDGEVVKSSRIRQYLLEGQITCANRFLGHSYTVRGRVTRGEQRGREIGFPTANIVTSPRKALPVGVFAVTVDTPYGTHGGMANVGPRPSFPDAAPSLEVHLFDFAKELYQETIVVSFHAFLRGQVRFSGLSELTTQLAADREAATRHLAKQFERGTF